MSRTESQAAAPDGASFGRIQALSAVAVNAASRIPVRNLDVFCRDNRALKASTWT
jgi:hypothetical protein